MVKEERLAGYKNLTVDKREKNFKEYKFDFYYIS